MQNREEWLQATFEDLINRARHEHAARDVWFFVDKAKEDVKLSCGFGYNCRGGKQNAKVYTPDQSKGGKWEVFINPTIDNAEDARQAVWDAMRYIHKVCSDRRIILQVDVPAGDYNNDYPHESLDVTKIKKQSTRMMKALCSDADCGFAFRTTRKHLQFAIDEVGGVSCPVCQSDMAHDRLVPVGE